uniref:Virion structural protein n=1 Tax=Pseudomonas phage Touem01 TaxID=3138548 RepID=A0AAU6W215_9VIRU
MKMKVYQPQFEVTITKTVNRKTVDGSTPTSTRFQGANGRLNLRKWLGDQSSVNVVKGIKDPAGGFSITIPDIPTETGGLDSLYGVIEPMDLVEIKAQHKPTGFNGNKIPTIMRGFVSRVSRHEEILPDGKPARSITIHGQDYGKIWQIIQIFYGPSYIFGEDILSAFKLMDKFGSGFKNALTNVEFLQLAIEKIVNPFLEKLLPKGSGFPMIKVNAHQVVTASVGIAGIQTAEGNIYQLLRNHLDVGPFNELYINEDDNGVYCMYRQNPALDLKGNRIDPDVTGVPSGSYLASYDATSLGMIDLPDEDIMSMDVSRSDGGVGNYYWVDAPSFSLNSDTLMRQLGYSSEERDTVDQSKYPNSSAELYGTRLMWLNTNLGGPKITNVKSGLSEQEHEQRDTNLFDWLKNRRKFLVAQNKDNSILESGTMRIKGNERIRAGNYIRLRRGTFVAIYYVVAVSHQLLPFRGFYTTLTLERGLGFANRIKMADGVDSPYLSELAK